MDPIQILYAELNDRVKYREFGAEFTSVASLLHVPAKTSTQEKRALNTFITKERAALNAIATKRPALKALLKNMDFQDIGYLLVEYGAKKSADMIEFAQISAPKKFEHFTKIDALTPQKMKEIHSQLPENINIAPIVPEASLPQIDKKLEKSSQELASEFAQKYYKDHPTKKFSGVVGLFASAYNPMLPSATNPTDPNFGNSIIASNSTLTPMPLANVQLIETLADNTKLEDAKQFGDKARTTTEATIAGSWRFHWGYEQPLLLTPRRVSIAQNLPVIRTKTDDFGLEQKKYVGTFNVAAGLMPNDPLLTFTRDKIYPGTKPVGDCACVGGFQDIKMGEDATKSASGAVCELPKLEMRKPNSTLLAFNPDSGEFGITGVGGSYANKQWRFASSISPKGLPKFKPSPWNEMPVPISNVFAGNAVVTYKPKENILLGAQYSAFWQEERISLIGRTFWKSGTNAALALDYGIMPNRTKNAVLEPMGLARMSVEAPIGKSLDVAALGSVGRYYDSKTNFAGLQLNATYNPNFKFKYPTAFNVSASWDSRYKTSVNVGVITNLK